MGMDIYRISTQNTVNKNQQLQSLKEYPFKLEKDLQTLFEANLNTLTGLMLVKTEFKLKQYYFDTLAFDEDRCAFVVIEYKRAKNTSVVDQGVSYLSVMLEYKDSLILEYNERHPQKPLKRGDVDWSQSRIIFVANAFTDFQKQSTNFKDLGIELVEFKRYHDQDKNSNGDLLTVNFIERTPQAPSLLTAQKNPGNKHTPKATQALTHIAEEIKVYDQAYHLDVKPEETIELYEKFKEAILSLDDGLSMSYLKYYIAFKKDKANVVSMKVQNQSLKIWINAQPGKLDDPKQLFKDVTDIGHHGTGNHEISVHDTKNLEYILSVIKQTL